MQVLSQYLPNVSKLAYGCMGLGGDWNASSFSTEDVKRAHEAVDAAFEIGINLFDHADIYKRGKAESIFAEVLKERPSLREQMYLQSKCAIRFDDEHGPKRYDFSAEWIKQSVDGILQRLGVEYIDALLLHRPDPLMEPEEVAQAFEEVEAAGKVRHFGVSNMHGAQLAFLQSYLNKPLIANQIEISLRELAWVDEGVTAGNPVGKDVNFAAGTLEYCRQNNVQLQSWGSLCQGMYSGRDVSSEPANVQATAELVSKYAAEYGVSREAIVLAWLMRHPANVQPVIGSTTPSRIIACGEVEKVSLTRGQWYQLYVTSRGEELP